MYRTKICPMVVTGFRRVQHRTSLVVQRLRLRACTSGGTGLIPGHGTKTLYATCACLRAQPLQSRPTLCDPMDCSPPGSSVDGIFPGKSTGVGCHTLLQGIFPTQGSNLLRPLHCRWILYPLSHLGSLHAMRHSQKIAQKSSTRVLLPEINLKKITGAVHKDNNRNKQFTIA